MSSVGHVRTCIRRMLNLTANQLLLRKIKGYIMEGNGIHLNYPDHQHARLLVELHPQGAGLKGKF